MKPQHKKIFFEIVKQRHCSEGGVGADLITEVINAIEALPVVRLTDADVTNLLTKHHLPDGYVYYAFARAIINAHIAAQDRPAVQKVTSYIYQHKDSRKIVPSMYSTAADGWTLIDTIEREYPV